MFHLPAKQNIKTNLLNPHTLPESPWESISIDIIGLLPKSNGTNAILSVIDQFSKMICLILTTTELSTKGLINIYLKQIWKLHGICYNTQSQYFPQSVMVHHFISFLLFHLITSPICRWHSHRHVFVLFPSCPSIPSIMVSLS